MLPLLSNPQTSAAPYRRKSDPLEARFKLHLMHPFMSRVVAPGFDQHVHGEKAMQIIAARHRGIPDNNDDQKAPRSNGQRGRQKKFMGLVRCRLMEYLT